MAQNMSRCTGCGKGFWDWELKWCARRLNWYCSFCKPKEEQHD